MNILSCFKNLFNFKSASDTQYYIEKYKTDDKIIKTYFKDSYGNLVKDIVNPLKIDNRQLASVTDNQGSTPHCAAYSICNWAEAVLWKRTGKLINLNADQVYAGAKQIEGNLDDGTYLQYAIQSAIKLGGFETTNMKIGYIYNNKNSNTIEMFKYMIHKYDFIHCGFNINEGWYDCTSKDYVISPRGAGLGGHAVLAVGYDSTGVYIQNSWGKNWGAMGFCILPWNEFLREFMYGCFITNLFNDM